ncbi:hypothetical protein BD410DRAFT_852669 [Rickenella mellea]|uniref:Uncharacterized protein n=1 Tax=Rickenella mellea TaxID=50990 RepID=A0A4Y7PKU7_9AGAM|nr:hypothetical protein BD410DRAFT_852669 [Rickenella mellea]
MIQELAESIHSKCYLWNPFPSWRQHAYGFSLATSAPIIRLSTAYENMGLINYPAPRESAEAKVTDVCYECGLSDLALSPDVFQELDVLSAGKVNINWVFDWDDKKNPSMVQRWSP